MSPMAVAPSIFILRLAASLNTKTQTPTPQAVGVRDQNKGMKIKVTVVTDEEQTVVESNKMAFGQAPLITSAQRVFCCFSHPAGRKSRWPVQNSPQDMLPETGSSLPLIGLLGNPGTCYVSRARHRAADLRSAVMPRHLPVRQESGGTGLLSKLVQTEY